MVRSSTPTFTGPRRRPSRHRRGAPRGEPSTGEPPRRDPIPGARSTPSPLVTADRPRTLPTPRRSMAWKRSGVRFPLAPLAARADDRPGAATQGATPAALAPLPRWGPVGPSLPAARPRDPSGRRRPLASPAGAARRRRPASATCARAASSILARRPERGRTRPTSRRHLEDGCTDGPARPRPPRWAARARSGPGRRARVPDEPAHLEAASARSPRGASVPRGSCRPSDPAGPHLARGSSRPSDRARPAGRRPGDRRHRLRSRHDLAPRQRSTAPRQPSGQLHRRRRPLGRPGPRAKDRTASPAPGCRPVPPTWTPEPRTVRSPSGDPTPRRQVPSHPGPTHRPGALTHQPAPSRPDRIPDLAPRHPGPRPSIDVDPPDPVRIPHLDSTPSIRAPSTAPSPGPDP